MEIVLLWCFVLAWMAKRGAEDLVHAVKGTPNPRYEVKKAKARAAGQPVKGQPRYATKEWAADLLSDALVAHTEKRRTKAKAKAHPVDDMIGILREPNRQPAPKERVYDPNNSRNCPECKGEVVLDGRPCPRCLAEQERRNAEWEAQGGLAQVFGPQPVLAPTRTFGSPEEREAKIRKLQDVALAKAAESGTRNHRDARGRCRVCGAPNQFDTPCSSHNPEPRNPYVDYADERFTCTGCSESRYPAGRKEIPGRGTFCLYCQHNGTADAPTAQIIQFPNIKKIEKEISMSNPEATNLSTAIAFTEQAATAHTSFATTGAEGYVGALEQGGNSGEVISSAREAMEASGIAADKWNAHKATLEAQLNIKEAYQAQPGAANKGYLLNG